MRAIAAPRWRPVTERGAAPAPDESIPFVLTPRERDQAALATLYLEQRRRSLNSRDALRGAHARA